MNNEEFANVFSKAYKKVVTTAIFSMELANKIGFSFDVKACEMPKVIAAFVEKYGGGGCFHHSWRFIYELDKLGIPAYWAWVPIDMENKISMKCVVVYEAPNGLRYVADVVEDIKACLTGTEFISEDSCKWVNEYGRIVDNSMISLELMAKVSDNSYCSGFLKIFPRPNESISFKDFIGLKCEMIHY